MDDVVGGWTLDPETRDALRLQRAREAYEAGDVTLVMVETEEFLADSPDHPEALALLADATLDSGDSRGAVAIYEHVLSLVTADDSLLAALGIARFESGDLHGAISASREAVRLGAGNADAHYTLGLALEWMEQRSQEAVNAFALASALDPERFPLPLVLDPKDWEPLIAEAAAQVEPELLGFWEGIPVRVEVRPDLAELSDNPVPIPPTVRGLYAGTPPTDMNSDLRPDALRLFALNIARLGSHEAVIDAIADIFEGEALDWMGAELTE